MKNFSQSFTALCVMASITTTSAVYASSAPVVLNLEGNPTCNSLAGNSISEARDTSPGAEGTLILTTDQVLTYTVVDGDTIDWSVSNLMATDFPVNFVILKGAGNAGATVFHYGKAGVFSDTSLEGPGTLKTVSFCYGLTGDPIDTTETVTQCEDLTDPTGMGGPGELNEVGIVCPEEGEAYSIHIIKKGQQFEYDECTCNALATVCDKSLPAGAPGACVSTCPTSEPVSNYPVFESDGVTEKYLNETACLQANQLREAPGAIVPWNNGSGWCSSVLGSISCKTW